ncbi:MAG: amidohydrolase family protein, partial [Pirellulales bacterium]
MSQPIDVNSPPSSPRVSRRTFLQNSAATAALGSAALASAGVWAAETPVPAAPSGPPGKGKVIDCHAHLSHRSRATWEADDRKLIEAADKLGIDQLCCSILTSRRPATAEGFRECNRWTADGMRRFPGRVLGYCYVNPGCGQDALDEICRSIEERRFVGIKLYNEHVCTEPVVFPVVELAIKLDVPILQHAGHSHYFVEDQPNLSDAGHLAQLARRYPEAKLICAHISGGGDGEWAIKAVRHASNVFLDTSGSATDDRAIEMAARVVGVDRLVF